jgi:hypothetical protein
MLAALPKAAGPHRWLTAAEVGERVAIPIDLARSCTLQLRGHVLELLGAGGPSAGQPLAEANGERWQRFALAIREDVEPQHELAPG